MSNYEPVKKYHDLVEKIQAMGSDTDEHHHALQSAIKTKLDEFYQKNQENGTVDMGKIDDKTLRGLVHEIFEGAKYQVLSNFYKLDDETIEKLKDQQTLDGTPVLEKLVTDAFGGVDEDILFDELRTKGFMTADNIYHEFGSILPGQHHHYRSQDLVRREIKEIEDLKGVQKYGEQAKEHVPDNLKQYNPTEYKDLRQAQKAILDLSKYLKGSNYHPDNH